MNDVVPDAAVTDAGELALHAAAARELVHLSGALRVVVLVDRGAAEPALVETGLGRAIMLTLDGQEAQLAHDAELEVELPDLPVMPQMPMLEVDPADGKVTGPLGAVEALAAGVMTLAALAGERGVATAQFRTDDPEAPLTISARGSEVAVALGDVWFDLPV